MNFNEFSENIISGIESCSLITDKYERIVSLGGIYKFVHENISVLHRVSNDDHDLCKDFITKININIHENIQFCLDEYNLNIHTADKKEEISDIIHFMDNFKHELENISPLDFIIEIDQDQDQDQDQDDDEYEFGPYDSLNGERDYSDRILCYGYERYDGYDGYDN
jgi:hypothetical protein